MSDSRDPIRSRTPLGRASGVDPTRRDYEEPNVYKEAGGKEIADGLAIRCGFYCGFTAETSIEVGHHMQDDCTVSRSVAANGSGPPGNRNYEEVEAVKR